MKYIDEYNRRIEQFEKRIKLIEKRIELGKQKKDDIRIKQLLEKRIIIEKQFKEEFVERIAFEKLILMDTDYEYKKEIAEIIEFEKQMEKEYEIESIKEKIIQKKYDEMAYTAIFSKTKPPTKEEVIKTIDFENIDYDKEIENQKEKDKLFNQVKENTKDKQEIYDAHVVIEKMYDKITFGKNKGKTYESIEKTDLKYLKWIVINCSMNKYLSDYYIKKYKLEKECEKQKLINDIKVSRTKTFFAFM